MSELRNLTRVRISTEGLGACVGRIEDIRRPEDMPGHPEFGPSLSAEEHAEAQDILRELGVTRVALISYKPNQEQEVHFTANEIAGEWFDMQGQKLTLEVVGQYEWPELPRT